MLRKIRKSLFALYNLPFVAAAALWRRLLFRTTFIAITGSSGKTTTKNCLAAILATKYPVQATKGSTNGRRGVPRTLLSVRPWHRFAVVETGILKRNRMWRSALVVRPDAAIITAVNLQHSWDLKDLETIAREKAKLLDRVPRRGWALLNGEDPRVRAMGESRPFEVRYFGTRGSDCWAEDVQGDWPERLSLRLCTPHESCRVRTQFVGRHWAPSVVAAVAAGLRCGVGLRDAARAVEQVEPYKARLEPVALPSGAVLLRDEYNGSLKTFTASLELLASARVSRRIAMIGLITDIDAAEEDKPRIVGEAVARSADEAVFVGERAEKFRDAALGAGMPEANVRFLATLPEASRYLRDETQQGDLVLLKAAYFDHLSRIYFGAIGSYRCQRTPCFRAGICDHCRHLKFRPEEGAKALLRRQAAA